MAELDTLEGCALGGRKDLAFGLVAFKAGSHELLGHDQQPLAGVDQCIVEFGMCVQCLVGGNRPRCGGPDDGGRGLRKRVEAECSGEFRCISIRHGERDIDRRGLLVRVLDFGLGQR